MTASASSDVWELGQASATNAARPKKGYAFTCTTLFLESSIQPSARRDADAVADVATEVSLGDARTLYFCTLRLANKRGEDVVMRWPYRGAVLLSVAVWLAACGSPSTPGAPDSTTVSTSAPATTAAAAATTVPTAITAPLTTTQSASATQPATTTTAQSTTTALPSTTTTAAASSDYAEYAKSLGGVSQEGRTLYFVIGASVRSEREAQALLEKALPTFGDMQAYFIVQRSDNFEGMTPGWWVVIEAYRSKPAVENVAFGRRGFPDAYVKRATVRTSDPIPVYEDMVDGL